MNARDENGVMINHSNAKRTDGHRDSDGNRIGRAGEILEEGLIYNKGEDRYYAKVWKNGHNYQGPYQVVIEKARADLRLYRKKFTLPNPLALVGPLAQTEGPSGPFPEKWMHGASDFIKVPALLMMRIDFLILFLWMCNKQSVDSTTKSDFTKVWQLKCCELVRKRALQSVWHQGRRRLKALAEDAVYESQEWAGVFRRDFYLL